MSTRHDDTKPLGVHLTIESGLRLQGWEDFYRSCTDNGLKSLQPKFNKTIHRCTMYVREMQKRGLTVIDNDKT